MLFDSQHGKVCRKIVYMSLGSRRPRAALFPLCSFAQAVLSSQTSSYMVICLLARRVSPTTCLYVSTRSRKSQAH